MNNAQQYRLTKLLCFQEILQYRKKPSESKKKRKTSTNPKFGTTVTFFHRVQNELLQDCPLDFATKSMWSTSELAKANKIAFLTLQADKSCITNYRPMTLTHGAKNSSWQVLAKILFTADHQDNWPQLQEVLLSARTWCYLKHLFPSHSEKKKKKINSTVIRWKFSNCKLWDFYFYSNIFGHVLHDYPLHLRIIFIPFEKQGTSLSSARATRWGTGENFKLLSLLIL